MSDPVHPVITFQVNLTPALTEELGPKTNLLNPHVLAPDRHQNDQDRAIADIANRENNLSTWLPGLLVGENRALKHGDQFTVKGLKSLYIKNTYTNGVVGDNSSAPLFVVSEG